jgi:pimeloyl-ACP methyl ester carboxylesterase
MTMESWLDHPLVKSVLFHPRSEGEYAWPSPGVHPVAIPVEAGVSVGGRLYPAAAGDPAILFFHGNGEIAADYDDIAPLYNRLGISLLVVDFRGYGRSGGSPTAANLLADAVEVFRQTPALLASHDLDPVALYVMGRSLGSAAAIEIAAQRPDGLAGLILESGFADTLALITRLGVRITEPDMQMDLFDNGTKVGQVIAPTLVIHGESDVLIPAADGRTLYQNCGAVDKKLLLIPGGGHNNLMMVGLETYFQAIRDFLTMRRSCA